MDFDGADIRWMKLAVRLARRGEGQTRPNPPVGAVVVRAGKIVGQGYHHRAGGPHAEILALRQAGDKARAACLYVTLEPCCSYGRTGPCTEAILKAGVARVVVGARDPNPRHRGRGLRILRQAGIHVLEGVCQTDADALIAPFRKWITQGVPYVILKMGMSLDGRIADCRGQSKWITGAASRAMVHGIRRRADAIMVGGGTLRADDPGLRCGGRHGLHRILVCGRQPVPLTAQVFGDKAPNRAIVAIPRDTPRHQIERMERRGVEIWQLPSRGGRVSPRALLRQAGRSGLLLVVCEGGGQLAGDLIRLGLVDEFVFFVAPCFLGAPNAIPVVGGVEWKLGNTPRLSLDPPVSVGEDVLIRGRPWRSGQSAGRHH